MTNYDENFKKALEIIEKDKIQTSLLAEHLGLSVSMVSLKINNKKYNKFTEEQQVKIIEYLKTLKDKIGELE